MARNRFTNPANNASYDWPQNHDSEETTGKVRNITRSAPTGLTGAVKQQGDDGPLVLKLSGVITRRSQFQQMWAWYALCRTQTIYFTDFDGQMYEVQIVGFEPQRVRNMYRAGFDPPDYHWRYSISMEVHRFLAGDLAAVGVTP